MSLAQQWQAAPASTRYLAFILIGVILAVLLLVSGVKIFGYQQQFSLSLEQQQQQLEQQQNVHKIKDEILLEQQWLTDNPIPSDSQQSMESQLQELTTNTAKSLKIEVLKQSLLPATTTNQLNQANLELIVRGAEEDFYRWAHQLHNPKKFCILVQIKLENDKADPKLIQAKVHIQQWFKAQDA